MAVGYQLNEKTTLGFGYRYFSLEYSSSDLDLNMQFHGPIVGISFRF